MTGFRVKSPIGKAFKQLGTIRASAFEPDVLQFLKRSLTTAVKLTPARNLATIRRNQAKQYARRINYIPSYHTLENPTLIVNQDDQHWLMVDSKWYRADLWRLPDEIYVVYSQLMQERLRRMEYEEGEFIDDRAQARYLFKRSWYEIGESAGITVSVPSGTIESHTRRKPPMNPPRGYAQKRGGKSVYSVVIRNPFLDQTSSGGATPLATEQYKPFNGQDIIEQAMAQHRSAFEQKVADRAEKFIVNALAKLI